MRSEGTMSVTKLRSNHMQGGLKSNTAVLNTAQENVKFEDSELWREMVYYSLVNLYPAPPLQIKTTCSNFNKS